ncbi:MAG TPA: hypothetical protein VL547_23980 [Dinghuibacter sp.]|nr:hypothetical protein [Dinghuibacter sp.]HTJ15125.1 hypothetical protein [Dinghuibacter sp.]
MDTTRTEFEFYSEGPRGRTLKIVVYLEVEEDYFNLSFGDVDSFGKLNDAARSDNGDTGKILMTVGHTVFNFLEAFPGARVYIEGSTPSRTRLYQMAISRRWDEITLCFDVVGRIQGDWAPFESGRNFEAFLISKK